MSVAISVIYMNKIKKILSELVELEKELCDVNKPKLREVIQMIHEEFNLHD